MCPARLTAAPHCPWHGSARGPGARWPALSRPTPREVAGAVMSASCYVPRATCLVRALTVQALLEAQGWPAWLRIGVAGAPGWAAHAWVEDAHGPVTEADPGVGRHIPVVTFAEDQVGG